MSTVGIVFSNLNDGNVSELTEVRTMGSVPFGGRYRMIDFVLSNMVNSGITKVGVITKTNYQSLMDHLGSGKDWDLARKNGGLILLPPFGAKGTDRLYTSRLEALKGALGFISRSKEEYVIMSDCDVVYNIDFAKLIEFHESKMSDITLVYHKKYVSHEESKKVTAISLEKDQRVTGVSVNPYKEGEINQYIKVLVMKRQLLLQVVGDAISHGKDDFIHDVINASLSNLSIYGYEYEGYYASITSLEAYYKANMDVLKQEERDALFNIPNRAIHTKVKDSPPTMYGDDCAVKNSFIADGCVIEGTIENSIIFRGARVGKGAVIRNCIVMQDNIIGANTNLNAVITDKNVVIRDKVVLSGHETMPFYIRKGRIV
ncbi:MAG: glucose-1-phosphate adenylyltransferase subunit GlgD [Clostridia bacterium]